LAISLSEPSLLPFSQTNSPIGLVIYFLYLFNPQDLHMVYIASVVSTSANESHVISLLAVSVFLASKATRSFKVEQGWELV
jgi:hypothetical protein